MALVAFRRNTTVLPFDKIMELISKMTKTKQIELMIALQVYEERGFFTNFVFERIFKATQYFTKKYLK